MEIPTFKLQGIELSLDKNIKHAFSLIPGINKYRIQLICLLSGISLYKKIKNLSFYEQQEICKTLDRLDFSIITDLKKGLKESKRNLLIIKLLRGYRLSKGLPIRGQKTKNNSKIAKILNKI